MTQKNITLRKENLQQWSQFTLLAAPATCNKREVPSAHPSEGLGTRKGLPILLQPPTPLLCCLRVTTAADGHHERDAIHHEAVLQQAAVIAGNAGAGRRDCITVSLVLVSHTATIILRAAAHARGANVKTRRSKRIQPSLLKRPYRTL